MSNWKIGHFVEMAKAIKILTVINLATGENLSLSSNPTIWL